MLLVRIIIGVLIYDKHKFAPRISYILCMPTDYRYHFTCNHFTMVFIYEYAATNPLRYPLDSFVRVCNGDNANRQTADGIGIVTTKNITFDTSPY